MPPGLILAGGRGLRLGDGDKALRVLVGRPLAGHVAARLGPQCDVLWLNANGDPARFAALGLVVLPDTVPDRPGPLAGVLAGLEYAAALGLPAVVSAPADMPFLPRDLVARLSAAAMDGFAVAACREGPGQRLHPACGLWPVRLIPALQAALAGGANRVAAFTEAQGAGVALFDDPAAFFNVNTPGDLARAEGLLGGPVSPGGSARG